MKTQQALLLFVLAFTLAFIGMVFIPLHQAFTNPWIEQVGWEAKGDGVISSLAIGAIISLAYRLS